jgi:SNF2 family DNA or RNA helicase
MVVDEGHSMGRDKENSTIEFAFWITANRRWAMSGTPTKQSAAQLGQLLGLMRFLGHEFFTHRLDGEVTWKNNISKCWRDSHLAAFFRLRSMLGFLMSRHTKLDIAEFPPPHFTTTVIPMSSTEVSTYNTLVGGVQSILITSMKVRSLESVPSHRSCCLSGYPLFGAMLRIHRIIPTLPTNTTESLSTSCISTTSAKKTQRTSPVRARRGEGL